MASLVLSRATTATASLAASTSHSASASHRGSRAALLGRKRSNELQRCSAFLGDAVRTSLQPVPRCHVARSQAAPRTATVVATTSSKTIEVDVEKPLGLTLEQKKEGGVVIKSVAMGSNAAKAGLKSGDTVLYTSSFFGDELWPADNLGFTRTAINAKADSVYFVAVRGPCDINVKRLPKRPAPSRFGRKLTEAQKARATHICLDCGYIYTLQKPFEDQPATFECPQCRAPKSRFTGYDPESGRAVGGSIPASVIVLLLVSAVAIGALFLYLNEF